MKRKFGLIFAAVLILTSVLSFSVFAQDDFVFTQHKVVLSYNKAEDMIYADIYISKGTAIVGYCSFTYDSSVLELTDINAKPVTAGNVPDFGENGNIYLTDVITGHNGVVITDIGKGSSKLINPEEGYFMFAWFLPGSKSHLQADDGSEVLIASLSFKLKGSITYEEFNHDTFWVANNEITDKVGGWYPGIVVMNAQQHQFNFDGTVEDGDLFILEYELDGLDDRKTVDDKTEQEQEKEPVIEPTEQPEEKPEDEPTEQPEEKPEDEPEEQPEDEPEDDSLENTPQDSQDKETQESGSSTILSKSNSFKADFNLAYTASENSINISWVAPSDIGKIENYTAVLCDTDYNVIKSVDIFNSSTSYTFKNIRDNFKYKLYFYATVSDKTYCSNVYNITTNTSSEPEPVIYTVSYDAGKGTLFGLKSEQVIFGDKLTKIPSVTAPKDKYFIGWSTDKSTVFDIQSRIYSNIKLYALYADSLSQTPSSYITGYIDGTFKPHGNISRAEAATLISRISPLFDKNVKYSHSFSDCESGAWYENAVAFCNSNGFITGYLDGTFNPSGKITRAEFATILVRVFDFDTARELNVFGDTDSHWACPYISRLFCAGIVTPDNDGNFNPSGYLTRKDAVILLNSCIGLEPDMRAIDTYLLKNGYKFSDVEQYRDYFYPIMAATLKAEDYEG